MKSRQQERWKVLPWILLPVILAYGLVVAVGSADWAPAQNLSSSLATSKAVQLAQDAMLTLHAVWVDEGPGNEEILTRRRNPDTGEWTAIENLSQFDWLDSGAALLFDQYGLGHLIWTRRYARALGAPDEGSDLMYRQWRDNAWQAEEVLDHNPSFTPGAYGLVLTPKSDRVLLFVVWNGGYRYAEFHDGAWSPLTAWDYSLGVNLALVLVDGQNHLHAAAYGPNSSWIGYDPYFYDAYYLFNDGSGWTAPYNVSYTSSVASDLDMAFDKQGRLHFVWCDPDSPYSTESKRSVVWERVLANNTWSPYTAITRQVPNESIFDIGLRADVSNTLHLAWSAAILMDGEVTEATLYYGTGDGTGWFAPERVHNSTRLSRNLDLLVGNEAVYLAWEEPSPPLDNRDIYFTCQACVQNLHGQIFLPLVGKGHP